MRGVRMTASEMIAAICEGRSDEGAFRSISHWGDRRRPDWNGFTTALVLRALRGVPASVALTRVRERGLDFLLKCESPDRPGAFSFWPKAAPPDWIRDAPPEDADDTSVCGVELARHGRLDRRALCQIACTVLIPHRLRGVDAPAPPWLRPGVFLTWLRPDKRAHVVDCCVNANVVALLAYAGLGHLPGFCEAGAMIEAGVRWAADSWARARSLVPFYPHPVELRYAVEHAVECGAEMLIPSLMALRERWWAAEGEEDSVVTEQPICSSAYGGVVWTSDVLQIARKFVRQITPGTDSSALCQGTECDRVWMKTARVVTVPAIRPASSTEEK